MTFEALGIPGVWLHSPIIHEDERGTFQESFRIDEVATQLKRGFEVRQVNQSLSKVGVVRGIHFAKNPPGQAKYVTCSNGAIWDFVVDIRVGSPTFGSWVGTNLFADEGKSLLISEGLGHGFLSLANDTVVTYLCNNTYAPGLELSLSALDPEVGIPILEKLSELGAVGPFLSERDLHAPTLENLRNLGLLPEFLNF
jgi:dTDP-4-dehydrorhamnose 3,5-epimerase